MFSTFGNAPSGPTCAAKVQGLAGLIGNTPLVRIASLSEATGCEVNAFPAMYTCVCKTILPCWQLHEVQQLMQHRQGEVMAIR